MAQTLEAMMVVCFGISWPISILKSYRARSTKGKSLFFLVMIFIGYAAGIASKLTAGSITYVLFFYILNFCMVGTDIGMYLRNRRLEHADAQAHIVV